MMSGHIFIQVKSIFFAFMSPTSVLNNKTALVLYKRYVLTLDLVFTRAYKTSTSTTSTEHIKEGFH